MPDQYDEDYYQRGVETGKSWYSNYRWMPEATIPLAATLCEQLGIPENAKVLDFGCAHGYLVKALRLLRRDAYGIDASVYAVTHAPEDVRKFLTYGTTPMKDGWDWILAKDVLEHLEEDALPKVLKRMRESTAALWAAIPLGGEGGFVIPAYELDRTHRIRRSLEWWTTEFVKAGFHVESAEYRMRHVKENWAMWERGNGFFVCR